jgi:hypothetical protein
MLSLDVFSHVVGVATGIRALDALPMLAAIRRPEGRHLGTHLALQIVIQHSCRGGSGTLSLSYLSETSEPDPGTRTFQYFEHLLKSSVADPG